MLLFSRPSESEVERFLAQARQSGYSYSEVGGTSGLIPSLYTTDHNRVQLGRGPEVWSKAVAALRAWEMFNIDWIRLYWPSTPIREGETVAVLARYLNCYWLNACRIVYVIEDDGPLERFGFAYGTLDDHAERGEERFLDEWDRDSDEVSYDLLAFSRPNQFLARVGYPLARLLQTMLQLRSGAIVYTSLLMLKEILEEGRTLTDQALERLLPAAEQYPSSIHQAMRHSVFAGGKRLRPILCMESAQMIEGCIPPGVEELGAALEMLHTYSLIHDDLPALDNDDLRRGLPTCHKAFGEATAILAGDALQTYAYEVLAKLQCSAAARVAIIAEVAHATGTIDGMIGGQVMDLEAQHTRPDAQTLEYIHRSKTGALLTASVVTGGIYAGASAEQIQRLRDFGQNIGLAFQIVDDVLDVTQTSEQLGKTAGKDTATEKATYPALFGIDASLKKADELVAEASAALDSFGDRAATLREIAHFLVERKK